ncbi:alpha/beta hydrolase [Nonomuraea typhae]|uniref:alpha/beta hydrolase n=1 Tax=Nonomuraea typhae TaxID=2603600 RepID=UPI0012F9ABE3|nr:alpha/beta hydrolase [Nonomuraea typhae]
MRRFAALVVGLVAPLSIVAPTAASAAAVEPKADIAWSPCPENTAVDCGTLAVPVDWKNPAGGTVNVAVARRKAADPAAKIGALVLGAGGPGGSGVNLVLGSDQRFSPELLRRFDIVGFDHRGVGRSNPVVCSESVMLEAPASPLIKNQAEFDAWVAFNAKLRTDCRARTGPLFDHVDSLSAAKDLDAFRAALGEQKISYWGGSYGTLLGQTYAENFPSRVRAAVLDSTMDHSLGTAAFMATETWGTQDGFNEFVAWCQRETSCLQNGEDVRAIWRDLLAKADRGEIIDPSRPDTPISAFEIIDHAVGAFYDPRRWPTLSQTIDELSRAAVKAGTFAKPVTKAASSQENLIRNPTQVFCLDYRLPVRDFAQWNSLVKSQAKIAPDMRYSTLAIFPVVSCLGQPDPIPNPQHRLKVRTQTPVLVANSLHDPATVYPWALSTTAQLGRSGRLLSYEGWGHIVYGRGPCATSAIDGYVLNLTVPPRGATCPAVPPAQAKTLGDNPLHQDFAPKAPGQPGWGFPS